MAGEILMPALSPTMEEGTLSKWLVAEGATVEPGDVIAEIETDKATMEVEAVDDGVIAKLLVAEGTQGVRVNTPIALLDADGQNGGGSSGTVTQAAPPTPVSPQTPPKPKEEPQSPIEEKPLQADNARNQTVREALRDALREEMLRDERVFLMGEEVAQYQGAYKVSQGLLDEFGDRRVIDTPITEHGFTGIAVGAAFGGLRPVVEFMTFNFSMQAIDQIVNSAAKTRYMSGGQMMTPMVFRGPNGAAARVGAQHSQDFASWYAHVPGLKVVQPYTAADAKGLLKAAIRDPNPVIFLENEILYGKSFPVPQDPEWVIPIGKARLAREGNDVTIVSYGIGMTYALGAAEQLAADGIEAEVLDLRSLRPMDIPSIVESVRKTNRCVVVEEGWPVCSVASEIAAQIMTQAFDYLDAPVARVNGRDVPMPYAANLEKLALPSVDEVIEAARAILYAKI